MGMRGARLAGALIVIATLTACSGGIKADDPDFAACNKLATALADEASGTSTAAATFTEIGKVGAKTSTPLGAQLTTWAKDSVTRIAAGQTPQKSTAFGKSVASQCENAGVVVPDE